MQRFIFSTLSFIIIITVFAFLWIVNPLYAFVGGVVLLVFLIVGFGFFLNFPGNEQSSEDEAALKPRRAGQYKRIEQLEKPEESWEQAATSSNKKARRDLSSPPQSEVKPALSPGGSQRFGAVSPAPAITQPDFDNMTVDELAEWTNPPGEPAAAPQPKTSNQMDTGTFFSVDVDEDEAEELFDLDIVSEIVEKEMEFDRVADDMKQKMEVGTFGDSAEEVENFFKVAFEKASTRDEVPNYIDGIHDEDEPDTPDWLAPEKGDSGIINPDISGGLDIETDLEDTPDAEVPDWLTGSMKEDSGVTDESLIGDKLLEEEAEEEQAVANTPDANIAKVGSSNFDLMGMVGGLSPDKQQEFFSLMTEVPIGDQTETQLIRLYEGLSDDGENNPVSEAQFTAYYPRQVAAGTEYGLYVYAHLADALINANIQLFESELGGRVPKPEMAQQSAKITEDTTLSVMIHCEKLNFNQAGAMQQWKAPFVRFDFRFTADEKLVDEFVEGRIAILMGMIEIASIDFQLAVTPGSSLAMLTSIPHNPLTAANFNATASASIYQKIFISYSHKDAVIAEQYRKIQTMAGNIIFMDTHSIRAGQDWEVALKQFIDDADVFQLFWSEHSAHSDHVKFEWDYALRQRCPQTRCVQFIRPAYWEKPLAEIPSELSHLHFAYVEMEND